jgi:hypothetical protein
LKEKGLMGVYVAAHWLAHRVQLLKNQVHPSWEYNGLQELTRETQEKITPELLWKHLGEIFQDTSSWPSDEHVLQKGLNFFKIQGRLKFEFVPEYITCNPFEFWSWSKK